MTRVICVHGVGQQHSGEHDQHDRWFPALNDGLLRAEAPPFAAEAVRCVFYGDLFRPPGRPLAWQDPLFDAEDVDDPYERELLESWWREAAATDPNVMPPGGRELARAPRSAQTALAALSRSRFFAGLAMRSLIFDLKQVRRYFTEDGVREAVRARLLDALDEEGEIQAVVAHSLGTVVAYEALAARPERPVGALVTLGSPLGIRHLVFDRLHIPRQPRPGRLLETAAATPGDCRPESVVDAPDASTFAGAWPGGARSWTNIADAGDVVALVKDLSPLFGPRVRSHIVHNGSHAHDAARYLSAKETGRAIVDGHRATR
ncbi:hypothetical protein ABZ905_28150 [Streptomyces parvus]|uniref:hypothetical protein n=1 Tax=Streptomyces parvus TaxID=66428 RepID=UPI0033E2076E